MSCEIGPKIVGCKVVMEVTSFGIVEGDVRNVDPSGVRISLMNGVVVATGVELPSPYKFYSRDIISSKTANCI